MRGSALLARTLLASMVIASGISASSMTVPRALNRNYAPARGKTGALKIRRAATKARNVRKHKRNCRG